MKGSGLVFIILLLIVSNFNCKICIFELTFKYKLLWRDDKPQKVGH